MKCSSLLLHRGQAYVRKYWLHMLGSITANLTGEPQAMHWGLGFVCRAYATLCWAGARHSLSPIEADTGGDGSSMLSRFPEVWSILLILRNCFDRVTEKKRSRRGGMPGPFDCTSQSGRPATSATKASSASRVATCGLRIAGSQTKTTEKIKERLRCGLNKIAHIPGCRLGETYRL